MLAESIPGLLKSLKIPPLVSLKVYCKNTVSLHTECIGGTNVQCTVFSTHIINGYRVTQIYQYFKRNYLLE
jgi:hypothetical protein